MSEEVTYYGEPKEVEIIGNIENTCRILLKQAGYTNNGFYNTYTEMLQDAFYDYYYISDDKIYEIINCSKDEI